MSKHWIATLVAGLILGLNTTAGQANDEWLELSVPDIMAMFDSGQLSSETLTRFYLQRISEIDQQSGINAITTINPDALDDARQADEQRRTGGTSGALHGIPVLIKDNVDVAGLATTAGSLALKNNIAQTDAFLVQQLRAAGAIILAKTNMAEWAFSPNVTVSSAAGITRNPYNLQHTPAGSSGGTGAGVSANFAVAGIGTDTGNSIRGPSSHNGLVGIRSTMGLVSRMGIVPLYLRNDIAGPMARTVTDAAIMLQAIADIDDTDPASVHRPDVLPTDYVNALDADSLRGARIGVMGYYRRQGSIDAEILGLFDQAVEDMRSLGAIIIEDFSIPDFELLIQNNWCNTFEIDVNHYLSTQTQAFATHSLTEVIESGLYLPGIADSLQGMQAGAQSSADCPDLFNHARNNTFRAAVLDAMRTYSVDAIVYPTWSFPPRRIGDNSSPAGDNSQHIAPHTGLPAITVPMGFAGPGLPAGISLIGHLFSEAKLIGFAYSYEQATQHRRTPVLPDSKAAQSD
ncbi:amidase [Pseudohongiella spirulinae]|uniref:Amidase n=1 Tax=Pseudohongiella spirulinae TaxID=1249552 RepID=A0A0S2KFY0_9GAMM|nr:amidase family protein [Pseudohongiella spirulinae]ALO47224.1 amidase [Pseudohongiella spirulinae]